MRSISEDIFGAPQFGCPWRLISFLSARNQSTNHDTTVGESVYDLLPKELQLPPSRDTSVALMSQTSGGELGSPPPAGVAPDASSSSSSSSMGGACSSFTTISSHTIYSTSVTDSKAMQVKSCTAVEVSNHGVSEKQLTSQTVQQHQSMPQRWTVLNISPPPEDLLDNSQMSCQDEGSGLDSEQSSMWMEESTSNFSNMSTSSYNDNTEVPRKSRKRNPKQRPGVKRRDGEESSLDVFDADSARGPHYVLSQLTSDNKISSQAGNGASESQKGLGGKKSPMLCGQYPSKSDGKELKIIVQPETQHRARYLTEGSRGSVKDRTQQGFPTVKLEGHNELVVLQVFVGNDSGRVKPHGFYQACRVTGRNTTPCKEVDIEGTTVIEVGLDASNDMTLAVDCVGILKLRNADVETRIGIAGSKKKSTRARLVFRVNIPRKDGSLLTLQTSSSPILCTQPAGVPEILKKSLHSCSAKGEDEVFLIGKNFLKGAKVFFQENVSDENSWKAEAEIDMELFHQNHLIVTVPPYHDQHITSPISVGIYVVTNAGRSHEVQPFTYTPATAMKASGCNLDQVNILPSALVTPLMPNNMVKNEDMTPMEVTADQGSSSIFKTAKVVGPAQQTLENISTSASFSPSISHLPSESDKQMQIKAKVYNPESITSIKTQDMSQPGTFQAVSASSQLQNSDVLLQQTSQFQTHESPSIEGLQSAGTVVTLSQLTETSQQSPLQEQAQTLQQRISSSIFSTTNMSPLQNTVHQMQAGNFPAVSSGNNANVDLVQQVLEAQQQLSSVLFSVSSNNESVQQSIRQEQMNAGMFQQVGQIQTSAGCGLFSSSDPAVHSRSDNILSGRSENVLPQTESSLSNQQQQAMETAAAAVMDMQQSIHQTSGSIQSDLFPVSGPETRSIQQSSVYQQPSHIMSRLSTNEDIQMQCDMFSAPSISGNENANTAQQQLSTTNSTIYQTSASAGGDEASGQTEQIQSNVFQTMVQMQHNRENQAQVNLFSSTEGMIAVQSSGTQQQGGSLFQQAEEMMALQPGNFMQQSSHSQAPLYHSQNSLGGAQNMTQETQGSLFHSQSPTSSPDQLQASVFQSQNTLGVLQNSSLPPDSQPTSMFLSQSPLNSLQNNSIPQEKQLSFFTNQNSLSPLQPATSTEQQTAFQQQAQMSHIQSSMLSQEQEQSSQQTLFQSLPSSQSQQGTIFQSQHSLVGIQNNSPSQEQQNILFGSQNAMATMGSQDQQNMLFNRSQNPLATQDQQNQVLFHSQNNLAPLAQEQQSMQFQDQSSVSSLPSSGSTQSEQQQSSIFHNSPQIQMVQGSPSSQDQQVTLFITSASMSALQNSITQQELQQSAIYSSASNMAGIQGSASPPHQQAALFHNPGGTMNQLQNSPASQQTSGIFLFGIQNNCGQLLTPASTTLPEELMTLSQAGQTQSEGSSVTTLLSQQMSVQNSTLSSSIASDQNMEKIDDLLVSLQNQGNSMTGSF
ncbi:nuclear factor of activated T-cells 5 isoform X2 [Rhinatrema bivittatum]|uniref:nuclear factor of activated T-cells 5 isoform X2 n=1 Tax=Rhinatrema bivittatum TaxID=194408 RepID=UPI00112E2367|nr:nuclear factor of activated T-cells 5 isoform X2 [Rhinatrema bivittatum]